MPSHEVKDEIALIQYANDISSEAHVELTFGHQCCAVLHYGHAAAPNDKAVFDAHNAVIYLEYIALLPLISSLTLQISLEALKKGQIVVGAGKKKGTWTKIIVHSQRAPGRNAMKSPETSKFTNQEVIKRFNGFGGVHIESDVESQK
ncbi:hypothetical protein PIB30_032883 [Stylosanthes scabra]|uniref:Uncharacterized protein n=1 Tax=Stylosanthes scabra TaxID=79078 RepID=A0ABU6TD20_9FABA|nr:hypothetical protein [Stylosanthes scabra]